MEKTSEKVSYFSLRIDVSVSKAASKSNDNESAHARRPLHRASWELSVLNHKNPAVFMQLLLLCYNTISYIRIPGINLSGPFPASDHMVQEPPGWRANCALGHLKQSSLI